MHVRPVYRSVTGWLVGNVEAGTVEGGETTVAVTGAAGGVTVTRTTKSPMARSKNNPATPTPAMRSPIIRLSPRRTGVAYGMTSLAMT